MSVSIFSDAHHVADATSSLSAARLLAKRHPGHTVKVAPVKGSSRRNVYVTDRQGRVASRYLIICH